MALTANASLKLDRVLAHGLSVFKRRFAPLLAFSTTFQAAELAKDKSLQVPYYPLDATASVDWVPGTGYTMGSYAAGKRSVPVDKRKFQGLSWQSGDLLGLPEESLNKAMEMKADKLAYDVMMDILSSITSTNFGAAIWTEVSATFDSTDVGAIAKALDTLNWPEIGRVAVLHQDHIASLANDVGIKYFANSGSSEALRERIIGRIAGIDITKGVNFPANAQNLVGVVGMPSALLIAAAPVTPDAEVMSQLNDFRTSTDPATGLTLVYRSWGNPDLDTCKRIIEFSYGYAPGDEAQLKRIVTA